eukprot:6290459-Alexandrium_andersonii.AAC.2
MAVSSEHTPFGLAPRASPSASLAPGRKHRSRGYGLVAPTSPTSHWSSPGSAAAPSSGTPRPSSAPPGLFAAQRIRLEPQELRRGAP